MEESLIHQHVEEIEFLKEAARREVVRILDQASVEEIIDDPDAFIASVVAAVLVRIRQRARAAAIEAHDYALALGLSALTDAEIDAVVGQAEERFISAGSVSMATALVPIIARLEQMRAAGVAGSTIAASLQAQATREAMLATLYSATKSAAAVYIQDIARTIAEVAAEASAELEGAVLFRWIAIMDDATCDDLIENSCAPRHNTELTFAEWGELGQPGAPQLICSIYARSGSFCRCGLERVDDAPVRLLNPVNVGDSVRAGRRRAELLFR